MGAGPPEPPPLHEHPYLYPVEQTSPRRGGHWPPLGTPPKKRNLHNVGGAGSAPRRNLHTNVLVARCFASRRGMYFLIPEKEPKRWAVAQPERPQWGLSAHRAVLRSKWRPCLWPPSPQGGWQGPPAPPLLNKEGPSRTFANSKRTITLTRCFASSPGANYEMGASPPSPLITHQRSPVGAANGRPSVPRPRNVSASS